MRKMNSSGNVDPNEEFDLINGRVATCHARNRDHHSIILEIIDGNALALFFTSKADWAKRTRRATNEEMAAANFVSSRRTYVSLVVRPVDEFTPMSITIPSLMLSELKKEFSVDDADLYRFSSL